MNLANLGKAGLLVAQNRLQTAGHNIDNAATPGYSRQSVIAVSAGATATGSGWIGRGIEAVSVQRAYDSFLQRQLTESQSRSAALRIYGQQASQVNNLVADRTVGISPAIQKFFDSLDAVATTPADVAARQELIGQANSLASQIRDANAFLDGQRKDINTQIVTTVAQINSYLDRIQDVNRQIAIARATATGQPPNDLLDQRDRLVGELGQLAGVQAYEQDDQVSLTVGNGQTVLAAGSVFHLQALPSTGDPGRLAVYYTTGGNGQTQAVEMADQSIGGGVLGGLLAFRSDVLDSVQNDLGLLALGLSVSVNAQHEQGFDLAGNAGTALFSVAAPKVTGAAGNSPQAGTPAVSLTDVARLTNQDYRLRSDGSGYEVMRLPSGEVLGPPDLASSGTVLTFDGLQVDTAGLSPASGDSWLIQPTRDAAAALQVLIADPSRVAAAGWDAGRIRADGTPDPGPAGTADGSNALALAALRTAKVLDGGSTGLNEAYSRLVNRVAVKTQQNTTAQLAQDALVQQNRQAQQSVSGVNLDEEYINLQQYQEQYRASARLIDTASVLFDTLLGLRT